MKTEIACAKPKWITQNFSVFVDNPRNCFFVGDNELNGQTEHLGIYLSGGRQKVVKIEYNKIIKLIADAQDIPPPLLDIAAFFETHDNVRQVSSYVFFARLKEIVGYYGIDEVERTADPS